eukprot:2259773-Rhodomonas_salina.1
MHLISPRSSLVFPPESQRRESMCLAQICRYSRSAWCYPVPVQNARYSHTRRSPLPCAVLSATPPLVQNA